VSREWFVLRKDDDHPTTITSIVYQLAFTNWPSGHPGYGLYLPRLGSKSGKYQTCDRRLVDDRISYSGFHDGS